MNPDDPMAYLENVLYPKMNTIFASLECGNIMKYGDQNEFFPDVLATTEYIQQICANNYFVQYESALTWKSDGSSVCLPNNSAAACSIF